MYLTAVWNDGDLWKGLPALSVPTLIIRGSESDTLSDEACAAARATNRLIQVETVEQASHLVPLERPNEVHALANEFIQQSLRGSGTGS